MAHHQVVQLPKLAQAGDMVIYQPPDHQGLITEANARATRIGSEGLAVLVYIYGYSPNGLVELTQNLVGVPFDPSGAPGTWREVGV